MLVILMRARQPTVITFISLIIRDFLQQSMQHRQQAAMVGTIIVLVVTDRDLIITQ